MMINMIKFIFRNQNDNNIKFKKKIDFFIINKLLRVYIYIYINVN